MCDKKAVKATKAQTESVMGTDNKFVVIRDVTPEALHVKGVYDTAAEADARVQEFEAAGRVACILVIPGSGDGDTDREVLEIPARTIKVVNPV